MATIGAAGFLASALLPPHAYHVRIPLSYTERCSSNYPNSHDIDVLLLLHLALFPSKLLTNYTFTPLNWQEKNSIPPLLGWLSSNLHTTGAVGLAIAINISVGAPGQIAGVWIYKADEAERGYPTGHWTNAELLFFVAVGCLGLRIYYEWMNRRLLRSGKHVKRLFHYWLNTVKRINV